MRGVFIFYHAQGRPAWVLVEDWQKDPERFPELKGLVVSDLGFFWQGKWYGNGSAIDGATMSVDGPIGTFNLDLPLHLQRMTELRSKIFPSGHNKFWNRARPLVRRTL